ncbi:SlyX family protein [Stieleria varia]|uniref:Protein SlyX n=1 Tax=Stieleria varia TaxID=2528005 RepID=A0A5C6A3B8_9BACT|nr:SlyX family protein [Stieleria varia]TWT93870.1 hypothetical protein Pla52n_56980 [Stieleria varia]
MTQKSPESRITELEIQLAHLQHHCDQLDEVLTEQGKIQDRMVRQLKKLLDTVDRLKNKDGGEESDPLSEKPPHY